MAATVTVATLFTDLVDSTALASRLGPEETEALRREHFALLRAATTAAGGTEVKSTGDGLMVVFPSASAAVDCAVAMQQALDRRNRDATEPLPVRMGISVGEAEPAEDDYYGQSVVEAARLCAAADGGQILAADVVRALGGGRGAHEFASVGALDLKGLPAPVAACEVVWAAAAPPMLPFPARLGSGIDEGFFGRSAEAELLGRAVKDASAGTRRAVLIAGEPGIGKTRLMAEAARAAHDAGVTVLYGRCDEDLGVPYQPFAEAIGSYVEFGPASVIDAHVERRGGELGRLVPELERRAPPPPSTGGEAERYLLFGAVVDLLARAGSDAPVLLILDDLHWADTPSLRLLRHLLASSDETRLVVFAAYREGDLGRDHPLIDLLAALHREHGVDRLMLEGLDDVDLIALLETRGGRRLDDQGVELAHALGRETSGNPFFVAEVIRHLAETGSITQESDGTWVGARALSEVGLPQSVREVVGRRVARLGEPALRVLGLASVIGRQFDVEVLRRVAELGEDELLDVLDAARQAALVEDVPDAADQLMFAHGLIEHTLYQDLSPPRRQRAHRRVAETLEALVGDDDRTRAAELAYHWGQATAPTDAPKAIGYARRAGDHALAQLAPEDAVHWFRQALGHLDQLLRPDDELRCDLLISLGEAQQRSGDPAHDETLAAASELAHQLGSNARIVQAVLAGERLGGNPAWKLALAPRIEEALSVVGPGDSSERARLLAYLVTAVEGFDRRSAAAEEAITVARRVGDPRVLCHALICACFGLAAPSTLEDRRAWSAEALELAIGNGDLANQMPAHHNTALVHIEEGDFEGADASFAQVRAVAARLSMPDSDLVVMTNAAWRSLAAGELADAERFITEGRERAERIDLPGALILTGALELALRRYQGRVAEVVDFLNDVADATPGANRLNLNIARAFMYSELGDLDTTRRLFDEIWAEGVEALPWDQSWLSTLDMLAVLATVLQAGPAAEQIYGLLAPWSGRVIVFGNGAGVVDHYLGALATSLGRYEDAEQHLTRALATHDRLAAPYWSGQTRLALAQLARVRPDPDLGAAAALARATFDVAAARGYATLERRARDLLDALA